jgi:hypothetical protein
MPLSDSAPRFRLLWIGVQTSGAVQSSKIPDMAVPYRVTSWLVVGTALSVTAAAFLAPTSKSSEQPGNWDACMVSVQYGPMHGVVAFVAFGTLIILTAQGLRIPGDADQRSDWMAIAIPTSCRSRFRDDGDHYSDGKPISFRWSPEWRSVSSESFS